MISKFGEIRPWTTELAAIERLKKSYILIMEKMTSSHFLHYFHLILLILAGKAWISSKFGQIRPPFSMALDSVII